MVSAGVHQGQPMAVAGSPLSQASAAMVMLHGRGASAADILTLAPELDAPDLAYLAPQAAGSAWYPYPFRAPVANNEPWLSSALSRVEDVLAQVAASGIAIERTLLLGFSQGACLALEFAARNPRRYGAVVGLSGALIENGDSPRAYTGSLQGVSVFLGCSTADPYVPRERVQRSAERLGSLGATVELRLYPNMEHTVIADEVEVVQRLIASVRGGGAQASVPSAWRPQKSRDKNRERGVKPSTRNPA